MGEDRKTVADAFAKYKEKAAFYSKRSSNWTRQQFLLSVFLGVLTVVDDVRIFFPEDIGKAIDVGANALQFVVLLVQLGVCVSQRSSIALTFAQTYKSIARSLKSLLRCMDLRQQYRLRISDSMATIAGVIKHVGDGTDDLAMLRSASAVDGSQPSKATDMERKVLAKMYADLHERASQRAKDARHWQVYSVLIIVAIGVLATAEASFNFIPEDVAGPCHVIADICQVVLVLVQALLGPALRVTEALTTGKIFSSVASDLKADLHRIDVGEEVDTAAAIMVAEAVLSALGEDDNLSLTDPADDGKCQDEPEDASMSDNPCV